MRPHQGAWEGAREVLKRDGHFCCWSCVALLSLNAKKRPRFEKRVVSFLPAASYKLEASNVSTAIAGWVRSHQNLIVSRNSQQNYSFYIEMGKHNVCKSRLWKESVIPIPTDRHARPVSQPEGTGAGRALYPWIPEQNCRLHFHRCMLPDAGHALMSTALQIAQQLLYDWQYE